ncbi:hypothetical protein VN12_21225 [Pirellula sp. SH-Sr6A]|uniref:DUF11 domain-containing protein n=1 Tax=Pirellula sp. SH-Sr6A TaxID=1632865 RepID=UPI00078D8578|nr:DUF11 domain-containing protein [Pirellula sp. SH-Sr6A]AMV34661.1 hypothetical protein VN12_21225 [Pirellula sp. SH-Sr6A]
MKHTMLHSVWMRWGCLLATTIPVVGCQSIPSSFVTPESRQARQQSYAQTPLAQSVAAKQQAAPSGLATPSPANIARSSQAPGATINANDIQLVQHTEPSGQAYSVPREPMVTVPQPGAYPPPVYGTPAYGAPAGYGHSGHSGGGCQCCNPSGGAYRPLYPQLDGGQWDACEPQAYAVPRQSDPQEYLFDGGDHEPLVRVRKDNSLTGLDPEDTVIQYDTADGRTLVESGCRVSIYAPRFASVRKKTSIAQSDVAQRLRTTDQPYGPGQFVDKLPSRDVMQPTRSVAQDRVHVVESVRDRRGPVPAEMVLPMLEISEVLAPYADLALFRSGDLKSTDLAKLAVGTAAAQAWANVEEINVLVDGVEATETSSAKRAQDLVLYEYKGARIRLCKVASEQMANPGDVISFTIRFDNVGEQHLSNLVITDSLTPRLEFIPGSDKSSLKGTFTATPNAVGSEVLRWEITEGIKPGNGGVVRFDCKVR